jgi:hypothetical protein
MEPVNQSIMSTTVHELPPVGAEYVSEYLVRWELILFMKTNVLIVEIPFVIRDQFVKAVMTILISCELAGLCSI